MSCMFPSNPTERIIFLHSEQKDGVHMSTENIHVFLWSGKINPYIICSLHFPFII